MVFHASSIIVWTSLAFRTSTASGVFYQEFMASGCGVVVKVKHP